MGVPVIQGEKTAGERFPGAVQTYCVEAMMQDRKALQSGTSHFLGQNFARASEIKFLDESNREVYAWTTSWGVSTRLIGGLLMTHSDDDGLVLPPKLASAHVVILPVIHKDETRGQVLDYCTRLAGELRGVSYGGRPLVVELDAREGRGGEKTWAWIKKGVPIRLEVGPRDIAADSVFVGRRDKGAKERFSLPRGQFVAQVGGILDEIQAGLLDRARRFRQENTRTIDLKDEFYAYFTPVNREKPEIHGGFALSHWAGGRAEEEQLKNDLNVTLRCIPLTGQEEPGQCFFTGRPSSKRVVFAKAY